MAAWFILAQSIAAIDYDRAKRRQISARLNDIRDAPRRCR